MTTDVTSVTIGAEGVGLEVVQPDDDREGLSRSTTFFVQFDQEEFGQSAKDLAQMARELSEEVAAGYSRQPRAGVGKGL